MFCAAAPWFLAVPGANAFVFLISSIVGVAMVAGGAYIILSDTDFDEQRIIGWFLGFRRSVSWSEVSDVFPTYCQNILHGTHGRHSFRGKVPLLCPLQSSPPALSRT